jgi:tRNA U34 5-carboxymethylaminomethyl modifying enzyme MnmG/GidA
VLTCAAAVLLHLLASSVSSLGLERSRFKTRTPLFNGSIQGIGPRHCRSLEDKVMRYLEGLGVDEVYVNGCSMSLPAELPFAVV